jgi:hypothetical protein
MLYPTGVPERQDWTAFIRDKMMCYNQEQDLLKKQNPSAFEDPTIEHFRDWLFTNTCRVVLKVV